MTEQLSPPVTEQLPQTIEELPKPTEQSTDSDERLAQVDEQFSGEISPCSVCQLRDEPAATMVSNAFRVGMVRFRRSPPEMREFMRCANLLPCGKQAPDGGCIRVTFARVLMQNGREFLED